MFEQLEMWVLGSLQTLFDSAGWLGVAAMMAFENATGFTPSEVILGLAGWMLISAHELPFYLVFLGGFYATLGSVLGASALYWTARLGGRPLVDRVAGWLRIEPDTVAKAERQFQEKGPGLVLLGRMMPGVRTWVSVPAGLARMPYPVFLLNTTIGAYIWCTLLLAAGYILGHEWTLISDFIKRYGLLLIPAGLLALAGFWIWKRRKTA